MWDWCMKYPAVTELRCQLYFHQVCWDKSPRENHGPVDQLSPPPVNQIGRKCILFHTRNHFTVNDTLSGEATLSFSFCHPSEWGSTFKVKNKKSKFFHLRGGFFKKGFVFLESNHEVTKIVPLWEKTEVHQYTLITNQLFKKKKKKKRQQKTTTYLIASN